MPRHALPSRQSRRTLFCRVQPARRATPELAFSQGSMERFDMATENTSIPRGKPVLTAGAIVALSAMAVGCQANSETRMYAMEAHAQRVEAWCYAAHIGGTTTSLLQQCVQQAWINVPPGECDIDPCTTDTGRFDPPYDTRRGPIGK